MKRYARDIMDMTKTSIMLGAGATAVEKAGGDASGLKKFSGFQPTFTSNKGAGMTLKMVKKLR